MPGFMRGSPRTIIVLLRAPISSMRTTIASRCLVSSCSSCRLGRLQGLLEEGHQFLSNVLGCEHRRKVPDALQFVDLWVGNVPGDVPRRLAKPRAEQGFLAAQE